jgi:SAM-dependent methyltransferase
MKKYSEIVKHYETCLEKHGDNHLGVDWPNINDLETRFRIMLDVIYNNGDNSNVSLLDFGCGTALLLDYLKTNASHKIIYSGLDISEKFVFVCKKKYPDISFFCGDLLDANFKIPDFDYIVLNGVFTEKRELTFDEMWEYFTSLLTIVFSKCKKGIAFNVMSKHVDWERSDLFHVSLDKLGDFIYKNLSKDFVFRYDYGLFEYTTYIYKH